MSNDTTLIRAELDALTVDGILKPEDVVSYAANHPKSALHARFEWDDTEAARQYRLDQARRIIRVYVVVEPAKDVAVPMRAFVSLSSDRRNGGGYRPIQSVLSDEEMRRQLLADALHELAFFQQKFQRLQELEPVFNAAKAVREASSSEPQPSDKAAA